MRGLSRLSRIMSRVTISVTRLQLPCDSVSAARHHMTHYWDDTRYPVITSWCSPDTGLLPARVLKDKFIVATFLRTSLLKISVELCFILPWINWISESSLRVHHAAWTGFCWLIFVADPGLRCLIVSWLYAVRPDSAWQAGAAHILIQSIRTWHLDFYQFRFLISLMDKS